MHETDGSRALVPTPACSPRINRFWLGGGGCRGIRSHLIHCSGAAAEGVGFDANLLQHSHVKVTQGGIVFAILRNVTTVLEPAAGEDDWEVLAGMGGRIAEVACVEDGRVVQERGAALPDLLHGGEKTTEQF